MKLEDWLNLEITEKGVKQGEEETKKKIVVHLLEYQVEYCQTFLWNPSELEAQIKITSELYEDPTNAYIPIANIYFIAFRKLKGKDIEPLLQKAREEVLQNQ